VTLVIGKTRRKVISFIRIVVLFIARLFDASNKNIQITLRRGKLGDNKEYVNGGSGDANGHPLHGRIGIEILVRDKCQCYTSAG
jgi:hypothetical protein